MASLAEDSKVQATDSHTYIANFPLAWCIGTVPHGGFVSACFQQVASLHFKTTLSKQNLPHALSMHLSYLRRTEVGPATFKVVDAKLGARTSTIHVTLVQGNREEVVAYITHTNMATEEGVTYPTCWALSPRAPAVSLKALAEGNDDNFAESMLQPFLEFRKAVANVRLCFPIKGQAHPSVIDQWMRFTRPGERFTNESLGFVADMFPQLVESYKVPGKDPFAVNPAKRPTKEDRKHDTPNWYPTVLLNLDVKKALPEEGVEWLFVRTQAKQIRNGRLDLEVIIMDEAGDLVALSHHVVLVVSAARNLAKRKTGSEEGSKL